MFGGVGRVLCQVCRNCPGNHDHRPVSIPQKISHRLSRKSCEICALNYLIMVKFDGCFISNAIEASAKLQSDRTFLRDFHKTSFAKLNLTSSWYFYVKSKRAHGGLVGISNTTIKYFNFWTIYLCLSTPADIIFNTHNSDVTMSAMTSQISRVSIVCLAFCSGADQRKHQSSSSLACVRTHKGPV